MQFCTAGVLVKQESSGPLGRGSLWLIVAVFLDSEGLGVHQGFIFIQDDWQLHRPVTVALCMLGILSVSVCH